MKDMNFWLKSIGTGLLVFVVVIGVRQYYQNKSDQTAETLSLKYESMLLSLRKEDLASVRSLGESLIKEKQKPYSALAAFILARLSIDENNYEQARHELETAVQLSEKTRLEHIARVRLARVLNAENKFNEALAVLETKSDTKGFMPLYEEAKGDIYWSLKEYDKARLAYQTALTEVPPSAPSAKILLKKSDLNVADEQASAVSEPQKLSENNAQIESNAQNDK